MIVGVTGTKGKTTITNLLNHCFSTVDPGSEAICTLGILRGGKRITKKLTRGTVERFYSSSAETKCAELTSFMLHHQSSPEDFFIDAAILTGIERGEHSDIHLRFKDYVEAKKKIFGMRKPKAEAIVCYDDDYFTELTDAVDDLVTYGFNHGADYQITLDEQTADYSQISISDGKKSVKIRSRLLGRHNHLNVAACWVTLRNTDIDIASSIESFKGVPGRFERFIVNKGQQKKIVIIDYAHTTRSLKANIELIKEIYPTSKLCTVFGCGGNKCVAKRPMMGREASELSDSLIITNDNPRDESPEKIIDDILTGVVGPYRVEMDREDAISAALEDSSDVILLAGKGAEEVYLDHRGEHLNRSDQTLLTRVCNEKNYEITPYFKHI